MTWTTPLTAVSNAGLTSAQWNASVRDNLNMTAPALASGAGQLYVSTGVNAGAMRTPAGQYIATNDTFTSSTYVGLGTPGPAVTVTTGTGAIVAVGAFMRHGTAGNVVWAGWTISGAYSLAASDDRAIAFQAYVSNASGRIGRIDIVTGLTPGSNTFTMQGRTDGGTGLLGDRRMTVIPL